MDTVTFRKRDGSAKKVRGLRPTERLLIGLIVGVLSEHHNLKIRTPDLILRARRSNFD
jgi:hypothetical protein